MTLLTATHLKPGTRLRMTEHGRATWVSGRGRKCITTGTYLGMAWAGFMRIARDGRRHPERFQPSYWEVDPASAVEEVPSGL
mgnify:CR=1 FL=1